MAFVVAKSFKTTVRKFKVSDRICEADLEGHDNMTWADRVSGGFIKSDDVSAPAVKPAKEK